MNMSIPIQPLKTSTTSTDRLSGQGLDRDPHSFSNPRQIRVRHIDLDLAVSFNDRQLHGMAVLMLDRFDSSASQLILDTMALRIVKVESSSDGIRYHSANFRLGDSHRFLGTSLSVELPDFADRVRIEYFTDPDAVGLQWLEPRQTASKTDPFVLTQSETINARSWLPLQDSPQVRITFRATIRCPKNLLAVMGAANNPQTLDNGCYEFAMPQPIPSYLMALAVGNLTFSPLGPRTGVYAEHPVIGAAAAEFSDIESMMQKIEGLYGPYRWDRHDILVLPPGFPLGGMENPRLTFATPTLLAGDKSLVSLIAHEVAHSWAGNLVTNATWSDFWLNEGFSVYVERRVVEEIYGRQRAEMEAALGLQELEEEMARLDDQEEILNADCRDRDPEECITKIPYEKGALFLAHLEETFGRERFDRFLRGYFDHFAFQSIRTSEFVDYLKEHLFRQDQSLANSIPVSEWLYEPGIPLCAPARTSKAFTSVEAKAQLWLQGLKPARELATSSWTVHEWLHFLKCLPHDLGKDKLSELDREFGLTASTNSEIVHQWLLLSLRAGYEPAAKRLEEFLVSIGREKLIKPLYEEMVKSQSGLSWAKTIYRDARPGYNPLVVKKLDRILSWHA